MIDPMGTSAGRMGMLAIVASSLLVLAAASSSQVEAFGISEKALSIDSRHTHIIGIEYFDGSLRRQLAETDFLKPLAVKSDRRDPTNKFRRYRGGFDISSKSYWASLVFTGVYGYAIGAAWLLLGLILALLACCRRHRGESRREHHSSNFYLIPRLLVLLLSLFAIGCVIGLFVLNHRAFSQANKVKTTVVEASTVVTDTIHTVTETLGRVEDKIEKYRIPGWQALNFTEAKLNEQAGLVTAKIDRNVRKFNRLINAVEIALIVILSFCLFIIVAALLAAFMRFRRLFFLVIVVAWIATTCIWLLFGLTFAFSNAASDTCQALNEFLAGPVNTTLDNFLPCVDSATSTAALVNVREGIGSIIDTANSTVVTIQRLNNFLGVGNGSLLSLCNPIGGPPDYVYNATCPAGTLPIADLPQVLAPYVCMANMSTFDCLTDGRFVSADNNATLYEFSQGAQSMLDTVPKLSKLADCSFVTDTFTEFVNRRCRPLKAALRHLWILMLLLSIFFTILTALWILTNHRNAHQRRLDSVDSYVGKNGRGGY